MRLADYDYALPDELIAKYPAARRTDSRLLALTADGRRSDLRFPELQGLLRPGDLLVFNDTRVIPARLRGRKQSGGQIELLLERVTGKSAALAQIRASKAPKPGTLLMFPAGASAEVTGRQDDLFALEFSCDLEVYLQDHGEVPLPPYLGRDAECADRERYQTIYARRSGAVAAPTAGLHFDGELLDAIGKRGIGHCFVTLHVGAGTFQPLRNEQIEANRLHSERVEVDASTVDAIESTRAEGGRVVAVGTTSVRALETAARDGELEPYAGETELFIVPGYRFRSVDALLTNFHLPRSSLLLMVSAFGGTERILSAYRHAVSRRYRFFSYGDAMYIEPPEAR